jgi:hypothetical protein
VKVRILDRGYPDVLILINDAGLDIVGVKGIRHRPFLAFGPADLGVRGEISKRAFNQNLDAAAIDVDRLGALIFPLRVDQRGKTVIVVAVGVRDKNFSHLAEVVASLDDAARHAIAGVDHVQRSIDHQQIGGLRTIGPRQRSAGCAKSYQNRSGLGRRSACLHRNHKANRRYGKRGGNCQND